MEYKDVFFTQSYQDLFAPTAFGGEPCMFSACGIEYRYYLRSIPNSEYFDITSVYGYSGPVAIDANPDRWYSYDHKFHNYCLENNIIAEFARLYPFEEQYVRPCHYEHGIFYIDLTQSLEQIWHGFDKGCRSTTKQQITKGFCEISNSIPLEFATTYNETMKKDHASEGYYFDLKFWKDLSKMSTFIQFETAGAVLLKHGDYCHYFLAAGGYQNIILWDSIKWAKSQGCKIFNLGGGLRAGDKLESFKRSFSKASKPFYTYRRIHQPSVYNELCQAKGIDPNDTNWFPAYRMK